MILRANREARREILNLVHIVLVRRAADLESLALAIQLRQVLHNILL